MAIQKTQLIVLKRSPHGETSLLIHGYSRDFGKLILLAKGARSEKSTFRGVLEPFSVLNIQFNEKKGRAYQFLSQAEYQHPCTHLKSNANAVLYGSILLELVYKIQDVQPDPALFELLYRVFIEMDKGKDPVIIHAYFILHYLRLEGLTLEPEYCFSCGKKTDCAYFIPFSGQICCETCKENHTPVWELPQQLLSLLKDMMKKEAGEIRGSVISPSETLLLNRLLWNTLASRFDNYRKLQSVEILRKVL